MINFASLFGSFNRGGNSAVFDLLQRPETSLDQLLDIETFSNEYKSGNSKVQEFMKYDKYIELIKYVTVQGPANNQKKGFKFPMVSADILSTQNNAAIEYFLPDKTITVDVQYEQNEQYEREVEDTEQPLTPQPVTPIQPVTAEQQVKPSQQVKQQAASTQGQPQVLIKQQVSVEPQSAVEKQVQVATQKKVRTKMVKQSRKVTKVRKQARQPLMDQLMSYFQGPINYTLAGYTCKVLTTFFTKKPNNFNRFIYNSNKNYVQLMCKHIESKSVGDLVTKMLLAQNVDFVQQRKSLYNHLIALMGQVSAPHIISNLAYTIQQIIQKTSLYIKTKLNITQNQPIIQKFLSIFYRTQQVYKILNNAMSEDENKSGYNCLILHAYLHHTEVETVNNFKLEEVLDSFIIKATDKLRQIPERRTLGMGRVKIVEIFSFLVRKQKKNIQEDAAKQPELTPQLLEELYLHQLIAGVPDFFTILIKLVQSFDRNNILHNQVFKILQAVLKQPEQNKSALQQLLLNDQNVLLNFIVLQTQKDQQLKDKDRLTKRKGYIGHIVNICKLINDISNNELLNQRIRSNSSFQEVLATMVSDDVTEASKNLAGYEMKKIKAHQVMFQKEEILSLYSTFLSHCPKPQFEAEEKSQSEEQPDKVTVQVQRNADVLAQQQNDQQKFNEAATKEALDQFNPKFWINHIHYDTNDLETLMNDL